MKKSKIVLGVIACLAISTSFCQNEEKPFNDKPIKRKLKVVDASIILGGGFHKNPLGSVADFQRINPKSVFLKENMDGYSSPNGYNMGYNMGSAGPVFSANLGFNIANKEKNEYKSNTQIRIGLSFSGIAMSNYLQKTDRKRYDTLSSSQTGQTVYADSITHSVYTMNYKSQQIRIDLSIIYRTNPAARWSMYGGLGIEAGQSIMAYTDIRFSEYSTTEQTNNTFNSSSYRSDSDRSERIVNKNGYGYAAYLPIGLDFRVGKKREFFRQLHLFYEARPFLNYSYIPELGTLTSVGMRSMFGLRVTI